MRHVALSSGTVSTRGAGEAGPRTEGGGHAQARERQEGEGAGREVVRQAHEAREERGGARPRPRRGPRGDRARAREGALDRGQRGGEAPLRDLAQGEVRGGGARRPLRRLREAAVVAEGGRRAEGLTAVFHRGFSVRSSPHETL